MLIGTNVNGSTIEIEIWQWTDVPENAGLSLVTTMAGADLLTGTAKLVSDYQFKCVDNDRFETIRADMKGLLIARAEFLGLEGIVENVDSIIAAAIKSLDD